MPTNDRLPRVLVPRCSAHLGWCVKCTDEMYGTQWISIFQMNPCLPSRAGTFKRRRNHPHSRIKVLYLCFEISIHFMKPISKTLSVSGCNTYLNSSPLGFMDVSVFVLTTLRRHQWSPHHWSYRGSATSYKPQLTTSNGASRLQAVRFRQSYFAFLSFNRKHGRI